jgi:segregation and condensation protein B
LARVGDRTGSPLFGTRSSSASERLKDARRRFPAPIAEHRPSVGKDWARDDRAARLEAVLFLAREPMNSRKLAQIAGLADGTEARTLVRRLNRWYDESGSAFRAEELAGGFQLMSRPKFGPWLRRMVQSPIEMRLSGPAQETLAVVAYRQPVLRAEIEAIRGVDCGEILRQLMDRDLVRTAGRANELGRPYRYATTKRFLQVFGLRHLEELPRADLLRSSHQPADQTLDQTDDD